ARTLSETPEGNLKWLAAISTAAHLIGRLPLKLTFSTESADRCLSSPAAIGRGCVKTFSSATGTQNRTGNRASGRNPHLLRCRKISDFT
ncbi:hypothetical protein, partial [Stutzerimonas stutzeri]|uniref:hypothetical protein n=1 Tax=Stutzerimonas stutzeri TaxID=316 RepID=UPI001F248C07